eukprot:1057664-Rhodomonas_salina.3
MVCTAGAMRTDNETRDYVRNWPSSGQYSHVRHWLGFPRPCPVPNSAKLVSQAVSKEMQAKRTV